MVNESEVMGTSRKPQQAAFPAAAGVRTELTLANVCRFGIAAELEGWNGSDVDGNGDRRGRPGRVMSR